MCANGEDEAANKEAVGSEAASKCSKCDAVGQLDEDQQVVSFLNIASVVIGSDRVKGI